MSAISFDELLANLHQGSALIDEEQKSITINDKREFVIPEGYNTIIAYEGDVNSQIITFDLPKLHEGHNLADCGNKILYWKNLSSGIEGKFKLKQVSAQDSRLILQWNVSPDAFTQAGAIEISISIYDVYNNRIAFAWNTSSFSKLSVAKTMGSIGSEFPPRDEILTINDETREIVPPINYNNTIAFQGDKGISKVYFTIKRYIKGIDILSEDTTVILYYKANNITKQSTLMKKEYSVDIAEHQKDGMILLTWEVPDGDNQLIQIYSGRIEISLKIVANNHSWYSGSYYNLEIKPSFISEQNDDSNIIDYLTNSQWLMDGNLITGSNETIPLAGAVSLRTIQNTEDNSNLFLNEIVVLYESNKVKLYINTDKGLVLINGSQSSDETIFPDTEFLLDSGNSIDLIDDEMAEDEYLIVCGDSTDLVDDVYNDDAFLIDSGSATELIEL